MEDLEVRYEGHYVYVNGIDKPPVCFTTPQIKLDQIPDGGASYPTQGFRFVHTIFDAQKNPVGWGVICGNATEDLPGGCDNLCKIIKDEDGESYRFEHSCAEHSYDKV